MARRWIGIVILIASVCVTSSCGVTAPSGDVEYSVTGTATRVDLTYENSTGGVSQIANAVVPWTYRWSTAKSGDFLYVSAQIVNPSGGSITATVRKDGRVVQTSTSTGFASIASASGTY